MYLSLAKEETHLAWYELGFSFNIQKKIFLTKLKGHPNLFVTSEFLYSQYRNKEENTEGTEDLFLYRRIFVKSVFVRTIFDCTSINTKENSME